MMNKMDDLLRNVINKYGKDSIAVLSVQLSCLSVLLQEKILNKSRVDSLVHEIEKIYNKEKRPESSKKDIFKRVLDEEGKCKYEFSRAYFTEHYIDSLEHIESNLIKIKDKEDLKQCENMGWYLYVLTTDGLLILLNNPLTSTALVLNRNDFKINGVRAVHPMLAYEYDFSVRMVGELCIVYGSESKVPEGVIVNNKSGHYRPLAKDLEYICDFFHHNLNFEKEKIISIKITC